MAMTAPAGRLQLAASPCYVGVDGSVAALAPRDAALLAWLVLEGPTPRAQVAALLWPAGDAEAARNTLRQRLFQLRKSLGMELVVGSATLSLARGVAHDLDDADTLLGETAGEELAPGEFAQWLQAQRARRRDRVRQAFADRADAAEAARDWDDALSHARELLALDPLSEEAHCRVMRLHYLTGDSASALLAFDRCEQLLKDEVGARPSATTRALLATIEADGLGASGTSLRTPYRVPASVLRPPRLVGRDAEWSAMSQAWDAGRTIVVTGEAGMGKTRLATDFAQARGAVLIVGARPGDAQVVHAVASRLLRQVPRDAVEAMPAGTQAELALLLPELGPLPPERPDSRTRFYNAVLALIDSDRLEWAGVVVDDLHFADTASIELLHYLCMPSRRRWLFTARGTELCSAGRHLHDSVVQAEPAIELPPLTLPQMQELLGSLAIDGLDPEAMAPPLIRRTGGNPMFVLEAVKAWMAQGRDGVPAAAIVRLTSVSALIERRIGRLSTAAVQLARCAAVAAPDFSIALACRVLGVRTLDVADPLAELEAAQVLRDGAFAHDLIYESALASVPAAVARELHAEVAAFLEERGGEPARIAAHWLASGADERAYAALRAAAAAAGSALRKREEADFLRRAAEVAERLGRRGDAFDALSALRETLNISDRQGIDDALMARIERLADTPSQRLEAMLARGETALNRGDYASALPVGAAAATLARELADPQRELEAVRCVAQAASFSGDSQRAVTELRSMMPWVLQKAPPPVQQTYFNDLAACLDNADQSAEARGYHQRALDLALQLGLWHEAASVHGNLAGNLRLGGRLGQALESVQQARRLAAGFDDVRGAVWHVDLMAFVLLRDLGRYGDAVRALEVARLAISQHPFAITTLQCQEAMLWLHLGQHARVAQALDVGRAHGVQPHLVARYAQIEGRRLLALGRDPRAAFEEAVAKAPQAGRALGQALIAIDHAQLLPAEQALAACVQVIERCEAQGYQGAVLAARIGAARYALAAGHPQDAAMHARAALTMDPEVSPDDLYAPEKWLHAARAFAAVGDRQGAMALIAEAVTAVHQTAQTDVPAEFRDSFLHRNATNRELLAMAARERKHSTFG